MSSSMVTVLLWRTQILERGHEISKRDWRLIRVAIVSLQDSTYVGCGPRLHASCTLSTVRGYS